MAQDFIHKQIGPFSGGVWIIVVVGGVGLALLIRRGIGSGGGKQEGQPILIENIPQRRSGGSTSDNDPSIPEKQDPRVPPPQRTPIPVPVPPPERPRTPVPTPTPTPRTPTPSPIPAPRTPFPPTPRPPTPSPGTPRAPGGFSTGCDGISYLPPDYTARRNMGTAKFQDRAIKLSWAIQNIASGPSGIYALTQWISSPLVWGIVNGTRRSRGLRAMTENEFRSLIGDLNGIISQLGGKENRLTNAHIMSIWERYNTPFLCTSGVQHTGTRATLRTGSA